jgi:coenzyme PQQ precursor peptide PqqA
MISLIFTPSPPGLGEQKSQILKVEVMAWITPVFEEVVLCCEINSYVSAKL